MTILKQHTLRIAIGAWVAACLTAILVSVTAGKLSAQNLSVRMADANFGGLPRVTLKLCTQMGGTLLRGLDSSNFRLFENGTARPLTVRCPDPSGVNSVVMVLDNSGSMQPVMPKLIEAASLLVDSLGSNDECAIVTFGRDITLRQDFTTDKALLKTALASLQAEGGTALFDASIEGIDRLTARAGNRAAVIITDGEDNMSSSTDADVIAHAVAAKAKLYTIAFNISDANQTIMRNMALATGGSFFTVVRPSELNAVYRQIAAEITEKCCIAEYQSDRCADSLRTILLTARAFGDSASDTQTFATPSRPTDARLVVTAPQKLAPFETGIATIDLDPAPSPQLELTLSFSLTYDDDLVEIVLLPSTLGSVAQNQVVSMTKIAPGTLRFSFSRIKPALPTTRLISFPVQGLLADSSRRVALAIRDVVLEGCPMAIATIPDTIELCQCSQTLAAELDTLAVYAVGNEIRVPLRITRGLDRAVRLIADIDLRVPAAFPVLSLEDGDLLPAGALQWQRRAADVLHIETPQPVLPRSDAGVLATLRLGTSSGDRRSASQQALSFLRAAMWQRCCPHDTSLAASELLLDGYCEKIIQRKSDAPAINVAPNPASRSRTPVIPLQFRIPQRLDGASATLRIVTPDGKTARTAFDGTLHAGTATIRCDIGELVPGAYLLVLHARDSEAVYRLMIVE